MTYTAGIDIGSAFSKAAILCNGELVSHHIASTGGNYRMGAVEVLRGALAKVGLHDSHVQFIVATGYGAANVDAAHTTAHEISCQSRAISLAYPSVRTVIDIGGQFSRVFRVNERGRHTTFAISEKCAGGSGRFLQVIARILQIDLEDVGPLSLQSRERIDFSTGCAVFAESETISRIAEGAKKEDILAAVHRAIAAKVINLVERVGMEPECAFIGGGAKDVGLVQSLEEELGMELHVPHEPQITAALGAALIAAENLGGHKT